jgi:hypothetical protein
VCRQRVDSKSRILYSCKVPKVFASHWLQNQAMNYCTRANPEVMDPEALHSLSGASAVALRLYCKVDQS